MYSFKTHDVEIKKYEPGKYDVGFANGNELWTGRFKGSARIWNCFKNNFINRNGNALVTATGMAYNKHLPLSLCQKDAKSVRIW